MGDYGVKMFGIYKANRGVILEGKNSLTIIDPGDDAYDGKKVKKESPTLHRVEELSHYLGKPLTHVILTHGHLDHSANYFALKKVYEKKGKKLRLIAHSKCSIKPHIGFDKRSRFSLGGRKYEIIPTPGHSKQGDDISIYLPDDKFLYIGDNAQPHGKTYESCDSFSCVGPYWNGDQFLKGLCDLLELEFDAMQTGHGWWLEGKEAYNALRVTKQVVERTRDLSKKLVNEHPTKPWTKICEWVYRTIAHERGMSNESVNQRIGDAHPLGAYVSNDRIGIRYWVKKFKK